MTRKSASILALALASLAGTASAGTILDVSTNGDLFTFTDTGSSETATVTNGAVNFSFQIGTVLGPAFANFQGVLNFSGSSTANASGPDGSGNLNESGWSGSGTIVDKDPSAGVWFDQVVFSFSFGPGGTLAVANTGTGGTLFDATPPLSDVTLTSPLLNFGTPTQQSLSFGLGGNNTWALDFPPAPPAPQFTGIGSSASPATNTASAVITFVSTPLPSTGMPEPTTMVMMGSALVGLGLFRRARLARQNANKE
jgi:hypothetical protein